ncbi:MAG: hypothetical protein OMOMHJEC_01874 [Xanthomonadales bacterium]|nr:hypothetical protein [Xanthomonadales bacterium]
MGGWVRIACGLWLVVATFVAGAKGIPPTAAPGAEARAWLAERAPRTKLFGAPGGCNGFIYAMAATPSGLLYLGGDFSACEDVLAANVAAYDPRTRRFYALGSGTANGVNAGSFGGVYALALHGGELIVGGSFSEAGGQAVRSLARWNGSAWSGVGSGAEEGVRGAVLTLASAGTDLYVGGNFDQAGSQQANHVARWDGGGWHALGAGVSGPPDASVWAIRATPDGLYVGGNFNRAGGAEANHVARWNGSNWFSLAGGTDDRVYALAMIGSELYAGGVFRRAGGAPADGLARWNGSAWSTLGSAAANGVDGGVLNLLAAGSGLYLSGFFVRAGDQQASQVARWDGSRFHALGSPGLEGTNNTVWALALIGDELHAGGEFDVAGGQPASFVASFTNGAWRAPGSGVGNGVNNVVNALAVRADGLYVGGAFTQAAGASANRVARWNGSAWSTLGQGEQNGADARVFALANLGPDLYVGGYFGNVGGQPASQIARWDGSNWSALGSGLGGPFPSVLALAAVGDDLYAGGEFVTAGGVSANKIARWNGSAWSALGSGLGDGDFIGVYALAALGSDLYAGGNFTVAGGQPANGIARWNGSAWSSLGSGAGNGVTGSVNALAVLAGELYVGGDFSEAGGLPAFGIARWDGSAWSALGTPTDNGLNGSVRALAVSGSDLYVGGDFGRAGGQPANGLARWDGTRWHGLAVDAPPQVVYALAVDAGSLYAGGAGLTQTPLPDLQSVTGDGASANGASGGSAIARAGGRIAFASEASNLVAGDANGRSDVYVRDPVTAMIDRASAAAEAINGGVAESFSEPALSADGARVAFAGSSGQVYVVIAGQGRVLSRSAAGVPGNAPSGNVRLPGNGSLAVFDSQASNLLTDADPNGVSDIYTTDLASGAVSLVTRALDGGPANGASSAPWASDDGQVIAFSTLATNLVAGVAPNKGSVVRQATVMRGGGFGQTRFYVSRNPGSGALGNGDSTNVRLTPDGRYGVFESLASNLVDGDSNGVADIFRFELNEARTALVRLERVSTSRYGFQANGASRNPSLCDDGQFVGFESEASNLIELDRNGNTDILVKWMQTGELVRLSRTVDGNQPNGASTRPALAGDCSMIAFASAATNFSANDGNGAPDVYRVTLRERAPALVTGPQDEPGLSRFPLPAPNPPNASCPAGFFIASAEDGPGAGLTPGVFGMELLLDDPGTRRLEGGLNFGGLVDAGQPGFAGFNFANPANENQRLNLRVTGSPASSSSGSLAVAIRIERRPDANTSVTVFEASTNLTLASAYVNSVNLPPGFYAVSVTPTAGVAGGAADGQFFFELTTSFVDRPGGGFQGGAVVGGYHAAHPFGGVSGFAAFCLGSAHSTSIRVLSRPSYGASGAQDLKLKLRDAQQRELAVVPAG